jgi:hypothetical protein
MVILLLGCFKNKKTDVMYINEEHLKSLSFTDFLKSVKENLKYLSHRSKTDVAIDQAHTIARIISFRMVTEYKLSWDEYRSDPATTDFWQDEKILGSYKYGLSDKRKSEIIEDFKKELWGDISGLLSRREFEASKKDQMS